MTPAERNYWPTELEIAGFVWVIKKTRHLVESSWERVIVQTDHSAILDIMQQSSITSKASPMRMNVRLVRASQFLRGFRLVVRHKPGKEHVIPDALSRLASANTDLPSDPEHSELDVLFVYTATLVELSPILLKQIVQGYTRDGCWKKVLQQLEYNESLGPNKAILPFEKGDPSPTSADPYFLPRPVGPTNELAQRDPATAPQASESTPTTDQSDLIFHVNRLTGVRRLCIPSTVTKDVLALAHGAGHPGFARCFEIVSRAWYIRGLSKLLRAFIRHCPECLILQTRHHLPYGSLQPIDSPPVPFHTITLDFILALPVSTNEDFNAVMSVTCKYSKRVTLIPGKDTWTAEKWALALLNRLELIDWGLPAVIVSDRDPKFLSKLWKTLFEKLGVDLLYSTAYHPQTDGSSERTNQTVEIALRFLLHSIKNIRDWPTLLPKIQSLLNNASSSTTGKSPNELVYGFTPRRPLDLLSHLELPDHFVGRTTASDAIAFATMSHKHHYDRSHQPLFLKVVEYALLRLHKGYSIPSTLGVTKKFTQQYVGPFKVLEKVGRLAYRLDIPSDWRIHPIFSILQLEPSPAPTDDPFARNYPRHPPPIFVEGDTSTLQSFEVERLLNRRVIKRGRGVVTQYLVRWQGYGPEYDRWYNVKDLDNASELVEAYEQALHGSNQRGR